MLSLALSCFLPVLLPVGAHQIFSNNNAAQAQNYSLIHKFGEVSQSSENNSSSLAFKDNRLQQSITLSNLALTYQQQGQYPQANQTIAQSLSILRSHPKTTEQQRIYAASLDIQGQIQNTQGQPAQAIDTWKQAETIYQDLNLSEQITNNQINQAIAMQQLGLYPRACQTLLTSLGLTTTSCPLNEESLTALFVQPSNDTTIRAKHQLGTVLLSMGHLRQAQQIFTNTIEQVEARSPADTLANLYLSLGNAARAQAIRLSELPTQLRPTTTQLAPTCLSSLSDTAIAAFQQSEACYHQASKIGSKPSQLKAQLNLASLVNESQHQLSVAAPIIANVSLEALKPQLDQYPPSHDAIMTRLKWVQTSLCTVSQSAPPNTQIVSPLLQQCRPLNRVGGTSDLSFQSLYSPRERLPLADIEQQATIALQQAQNIGDSKATANALGYLGAIALQQNNTQQGQTYTEQALQQASAYESPETQYLWLWQLGRIHRQAGRTQEAIAAYSSAHQILKNLRSDLASASPDVQFAFRDRVEPVYRELVDLLLSTDSPSQTHLAQARDVIESLQLAELHNFYQQACLEANPQAIETIDQTAAVIYAITLQKRLAVITSIPDQPLHYHNVALGRSGDSTPTIDQAVTDLLASISLPKPDPLVANRQIYDWLIRPSVSEFKTHQIKTLVFVLDGALREVPVAALHNGQSYLIEDYNLALTPGLQLLSAQSLTKQKLTALAAGLTETSPPLPEVKRELQKISEVLPTEVLLNDRFTSDRLEQSIQDVPYNIVHLATHAQFSSKAEQTFLEAYDKNINVNELDAVLRERERRLAKRPIELLVLSACQTAAGDNRAALGLAGVAMRSGARSTLASLWSIQDRSTAELMRHFYDALKQPGLSKADALRQAQLQMLRSPEYRDPVYWAAFVLVGNWL